MSRRTAAIIERAAEEWVLVADGWENEKHVVHIRGREELEKARRVFERLLAEKARLVA